MRYPFLSLALFLATLSTPALADLTANYVGPNAVMTMKIEIASNGDARGATSSPNAYFITHDGHSYMVQATFDGPAVMRIEDVSTVMTEQFKKLAPKVPKDEDKNVPGFQLVKGGIVRIRGREGTAYYLGARPKAGSSEPPFVVISTDPQLAPLGAVMARQFDISVGAMGQIIGDKNPFKSVQDVLKTGAPLVFTGMELDTVNVDPIPAARFTLPAEPLTLEGVRKTMGASGK